MTLAKTGLSTTADISVDYATENGVDIHPHRHQLFTDFPVHDPPSREDTLGHDPDALLQLKFSTAAALWLSIRKPYLKARTFYMYGHHIKQLNKAFAELPIGKMHIGDLRKYQLARLGNTDKLWARAAGPSLIRHEMSVVEMVLKRAGVW
ncbi:MAG: hypothetical protein ACRELE_12650, partial [Gemmatimonadales bacterium]